MSVPAELRYTAEHEWVAVDGTSATIGITDYAARALGDVVYVSLPAQGAAVVADRHARDDDPVKPCLDRTWNAEVVEAHPDYDRVGDEDFAGDQIGELTSFALLGGALFVGHEVGSECHLIEVRKRVGGKVTVGDGPILVGGAPGVGVVGGELAAARRVGPQR